MELLTARKSVAVGELSEEFNVAQETIRRDLKKLEEEGLVQRIHGGAVLSGLNGGTLPFNIRAEARQEEKAAIAEAAAALVKSGDTILLDSGTTTTQIARRIRNIKDLIVVTNALNIAIELAGIPDISVNVTGGCVRGTEFCLLGPETEKSLRRIRVDKAFVAASGVSLDHGLAVADGFSAAVKSAMVDAARRAILVVDSSKFGDTALLSYAPIDSIGTMITDAGIAREIVDELRSRNIEVILAGSCGDKEGSISENGKSVQKTGTDGII